MNQLQQFEILKRFQYKYRVTIKEIGTFNVTQYQNPYRSGHTIHVVAQRNDEKFFRTFFRDVSTTSAPLTSLKQNGCYCGREGFLCDAISEDELRYSCTASFQKTIWQTPTYKAVYLRLEQEISRKFCLCRGKSSGRPPVSEDRIRLSY